MPALAQPGAGPSSAGGEATPVRFDFSSPACGSAQDFIARVRRRSARIHLLAESSGGRTLIVAIRRPDAAGSLAGTVKVIEPNGATRARQLKANSCDEVLEGLSLIATVTLDPEALLDEAIAEVEPEPGPEPPKPAEPASPVPAPAPIRVAAQRPGHGHRVSFGAEAASLVGMSPDPAFGAATFAAFELNAGAVWAPLWRLSVIHAQRRAIPERLGEASFAFTLPTLDVCPLRLGPRAVSVRPCAFGSFGLLEVWGSGTPQDERHSRASGSAGASLLLIWSISEVFEIVADGRGGVPVWRQDFAFDDVVFFKTRTLVFSAAVGVAVGFP